MDRLSAHLDRAWELLSTGDTRAARAAAKRALEIDGQSPEAYNLLGHLSAQEGEVDEAMEHYRTAMSLDDGYPDPMLGAAELLIHPLRDFEAAIELCDDVLEFAETTEELLDAVLLKFDAVLQHEGHDAARRVLDRLPEGPYEHPTQALMVGRALFEAGDFDRALQHLVDAAQRAPENPDAHYYLGLAREQRGEYREAMLALLESRTLDEAVPPPAWSLPREQFQKAVERAWASVDRALTDALGEVVVIVSSLPGVEVVADGVDPRAPLLFEGVHGTPPEGAPKRVARLFVYKTSIERLCVSLDDLDEELTRQISEELRHLAEEGVIKPATRDEETRKKPRKSR